MSMEIWVGEAEYHGDITNVGNDRLCPILFRGNMIEMKNRTKGAPRRVHEAFCSIQLWC